MMETPFAMYDALSAIEVPPEKVRVVVQSMERDMALFATSAQFNQLDQFSGSRFDLLRAEIAACRARVDDMNERFEQVNDKLQALDKKLSDLSQHLENRLLVKLGAMLGGVVALLGGLMVLIRG